MICIFLFFYIVYIFLNYIFRVLFVVMIKFYIVFICMGYEGVDGVKILLMVRLWVNVFFFIC